MLEGLNKLDLNAFINKAIEYFFVVVKLPITFWMHLPAWFRWSVYVLVFLFAVFMLWAIIKTKNAYKYRY